MTALLPEAQAAAAALGVEPRLLLAQAALETGWGRAAPQRDGEPAHNLFGIKAGASWSGAAVEHWTLEHEGGVTAPQRERFRAYGDTAESFADYVDLISTARRYADALAQAGDAEAYARARDEGRLRDRPELRGQVARDLSRRSPRAGACAASTCRSGRSNRLESCSWRTS